MTEDRLHNYGPEDVESSVPARFEEMVAGYPDRVALQSRAQAGAGSMEPGLGTALTYESLNRSANRLAHALLAQLGPRSEPVAILAEQGLTVVVAILGALKAGKIYVPLDPSHPPVRLAAILRDSSASVLVTNGANQGLASSLIEGADPAPVVFDLDDLDRDLPSTNPGLVISSLRFLNIMYTSGSTGQPKGAVQTHGNLLHMVYASLDYSPRTAQDRLLQVASFSMGASAATLFSTLLTGGTVVIYDLKRNGIDGLAAALSEEEISHVQSVPTVFRHLLHSLKPGQIFPAMKHVALGGEPVYRSDFELFKKHFLPGCKFRVGLGTTENYLSTRNILDHDTKVTTRVVPVGRAVHGGKPFVLRAPCISSSSADQLAQGEVGEIGFESPYLSPGYWRRPKATAASYRPAPEGTGERIYLFGDLGRLLPGGDLEHLGRRDSQIKVRGHRVEPAEVEAALLEIDGVEEAVVMGRELRPGETRLIGYVVPAAPDKNVHSIPERQVRSVEEDVPVEQVLTSSTLRAAVARVLPDYMVPAAYVVLDRLPLLPFGKVNVNALPLPELTRPDLATEYVPPQNWLEQALEQIWSEVLGVQGLGVRDSFFELGGHSLAAATVAGHIAEELGADLPASALFESPTIADLATRIMAVMGESLEDGEPLDRALQLLGPV